MSNHLASVATPLDLDASQWLEEWAAGQPQAVLWWASGYLAARAQGAPPALSAVAAPAADAMLILTASQTGNSRRLGERLRERLVSVGHTVRLVSAADVTGKQLAAATSLWAVVSTQGEGDPPDEARGLWELLSGRKAPKLSQATFAVFGLGDSSYPKFCEAGKFLDERLATLGGTRLLARVDADVEYADEADAWLEAIVKAAPAPIAANASRQSPLRSVAPLAARQAERDTPREVPVLAAQSIVGKKAGRAVWHYELEGGADFAYEPGDSLGIWPVNPPTVVARVKAQLADAPAQVTRGKLERPLEDWLTEHLEITRVARPFLEAQAVRSDSSELKGLLDKTPEAAVRLQSFMLGVNAADVLERFPVLTGQAWSAADLLAVLRPLTPRLYSIASSRKTVGDEVHLTVAGVTDGAASTHLWRRGTDGGVVRAYIERNEHFRLPADPSRDVIMIGPGTGVAPFRAFVQERAEIGASGRHWLFFGARHFDSEFLYQLEWQQALKEGRLNRLDLAFPRDQSTKIYVQQRLRERAADLWQWLEGGASVYVCGDATHMAADVHAALRDVAQSAGRLDAAAADAWLSDLAANKRYLRDVY